jgi:hypothetical protein
MGAAAEPHHPEARRGHGPSAGEHDPKGGEARRAGRGRHDVAGESREHPVRGGEEGAEEGRDACQQQERARRGDQQGVAAGQSELAGEKDPPRSPPVRQAPARDGQDQVHDRLGDEEEREPALVDAHPAPKGEEEEGVADRRDAEQRRGHQHPAIEPVGPQGAQRAPEPGCGPGMVGRAVLDEQHEDRQAAHGDEAARQEDVAVRAGGDAQQHDRQQGPGERTPGVEHPVQPEGLPEPPRGSRQGDQGVPGPGADPLAEPVRGEPAQDREPPPGTPQSQARHGREPVPGAGDLPVAAPAVGQQCSHQPRQGRGEAHQPVRRPELQRGEPQADGQVQRQDRGHHLAGDVGDEAGHAEQRHVGSDEQAAPAARAGTLAGGRPGLPIQNRRGPPGEIHACPRVLGP